MSNLVFLSLTLFLCVSPLLSNYTLCVCVYMCIKEITRNRTQNDLLLIIIIAVRAIRCVRVWGRQ